LTKNETHIQTIAQNVFAAVCLHELIVNGTTVVHKRTGFICFKSLYLYRTSSVLTLDDDCQYIGMISGLALRYLLLPFLYALKDDETPCKISYARK